MAIDYPRTLPADLRAEAALQLLPQRGTTPDELMLLGEPVRHIDAWGGAALRTTIEYFARYQQRQVTLSMPESRPACELLHGLVRHDHPAHLVLPSDSNQHDAPQPPNVLLAARRVPAPEHADALAEDLFERGSGRLREPIRFAAKHLPELSLNALTHGGNSPTAPVVCAVHEREEDEVQLVIIDLGSRMARDNAEALEHAVRGRADGHLRSLVESAQARDIDLSLTLASGVGRLYWRDGRWSRATAEAVPGFTAALTLPC